MKPTNQQITNPIGYRAFHPEMSLNYQLNRWLPTMDEAEVLEVAPRIGSLDDWRQQLTLLARRAEADGRALHASTYYRAAEFFMTDADPERKGNNAKYLALYDEAVKDWPIERRDVPFEGGFLPVLAMRAHGPARDTLVIHGGFDSYKEEFFMAAPDYAAAGFDVVAFDGPGQGQAIRRHGLTMGPDWERPVAAVLDRLKVETCTLMGFSLGGYLALRAAAFEKRVRRVIANDVLWDFFAIYMDRGGPGFGARVQALLEAEDRRAANQVVERLTEGNANARWAVAHGQEVSGAHNGYEYLRWLSHMRTRPFADRIDQDVLLFGAQEDHIVPVDQFYSQIGDLTHVRSLTAQLFTRADNAQAHCHVGNTPLVVDYVIGWMNFQLRAEQVRATHARAG